jgi:hypothetical protein
MFELCQENLSSSSSLLTSRIILREYSKMGNICHQHTTNDLVEVAGETKSGASTGRSRARGVTLSCPAVLPAVLEVLEYCESRLSRLSCRRFCFAILLEPRQSSAAAQPPPAKTLCWLRAAGHMF